MEAVRAALDRALAEISALTETFIPVRIITLSLAETIDMAVRRHELNTGAQVNREIGRLPISSALCSKDYIDKFILEALRALQDRTDTPTVGARQHRHLVEVQIQVPAHRFPDGIAPEH